MTPAEAAHIMAHEGDDHDVVAVLTVKVFRSGAMSVAGDIHEEAFALACLEQAKQAIKDHHGRGTFGLIVPAHDSAMRV